MFILPFSAPLAYQAAAIGPLACLAVALGPPPSLPGIPACKYPHVDCGFSPLVCRSRYWENNDKIRGPKGIP